MSGSKLLSGLTRRHFLLAGGAAAALLVGGGAAYRSFAPRAARRWVVEVVRRNLPDVPIDEEALERFADDVVKSPTPFGPKRGQVAISTYQGTRFVGFRFQYGDMETLERYVLSEFLTCSDFFPVREPRVEPVRYSGQLVACGNIFARYREG